MGLLGISVGPRRLTVDCQNGLDVGKTRKVNLSFPKNSLSGKLNFEKDATRGVYPSKPSKPRVLQNLISWIRIGTGSRDLVSLINRPYL